MRYVDQPFVGQTVPLDGNQFIRCTFRDATLVFTASGADVTIESCRFERPWRIAYGGEAEATIRLLGELYHESPEKAQLVETLFGHMRDRTDARATLRLLSWERLRSPGASTTVAFLAGIHSQGHHGAETIETLFADIRAGEFRQLGE